MDKIYVSLVEYEIVFVLILISLYIVFFLIILLFLFSYNTDQEQTSLLNTILDFDQNLMTDKPLSGDSKNGVN
jgi:nitrogen fixation-related uncharacterized protein